MNIPDLASLRLLCTLVAASIVSSGCSINGNYPDAPQADAAKLRFITKLDSTSLSLFDAEHCEGQTAGLLNNLFTADTARRVNMTVPAPVDAGPHIEIRLTPGKEHFLQTNMVTTGYVFCTTYIKLTPQPGSEYEMTLTREGNQCVTSLTTLHQVDGKVSRRALPVMGEALTACAGTSAIFPRFDPKPDTVERTAMIEKIIADLTTSAMKASPAPVDPALREAKLRNMIDQRQKDIGFTLPDAYWVEYRQGLTAFKEAEDTQLPQTLRLYQDDSQTRLRAMETDKLKALVKLIESGEAGSNYASRFLSSYYSLKDKYLKEQLFKLNTHLAGLDKRYGVCERFADCWRN